MQAFRLPLPAEKEMPGLAIQDFAFQQLPRLPDEEGLLIGQKVTGAGKKPIRLSTTALSRHLYIMGQTGTGKSTLLKTMIADCIKRGMGFTIIDPHGDLFSDVYQMLPAAKRKKISIIDPADPENTMGIDPLQYDEDDPQSKSLVINELMRTISSFYDMKVAGGPMFEIYFKNAMQLLLNSGVRQKFGHLTLVDFCRIFFEPDFRKALLSVCDERAVNRFFELVVKTSGDQAFENFAPYITSKINRFVEDYYLQPLVTQKNKRIQFKKLLSAGQILLVRMDKGKIGADNTSLLGQLVLSQLFMAGMSRSGINQEKRKPYYIFIDEFQNFMRGDVGTALAEMRKYGLALVLANQTLGQLDNYLVEAVLGNAGNLVFFRPGINDYPKIQHYLEPEFTRQHVLKLPNFNCIARLLVNNVPSDPFVFQTAYDL